MMIIYFFISIVSFSVVLCFHDILENLCLIEIMIFSPFTYYFIISMQHVSHEEKIYPIFMTTWKKSFDWTKTKTKTCVCWVYAWSNFITRLKNLTCIFWNHQFKNWHRVNLFKLKISNFKISTLKKNLI